MADNGGPHGDHDFAFKRPNNLVATSSTSAGISFLCWQTGSQFEIELLN